MPSRPPTALDVLGAMTLATADTGQVVTLVPSQRWVRAIRDGRAIGDTRAAVLVLTSGPGPHRPPLYAFPRSHVAAGRLRAQGQGICPIAGPFTVYTLECDAGSLADAAFAYTAPPAPLAALAEHVLFTWKAAESWWEEDEQIFGHATDPFHRVDAIVSRRQVTVRLGTVVLAQSQRPTMVFETNRPPRAYLPAGDVRLDLLTVSERRTRCPVKGLARYWDVRRRDGAPVTDAAWSYPFPVPQQPAIAGLICFDPERVEVHLGDAPSAGR